MTDKHPLETTWWKLITTLAGVAAVSVAGTWTVSQLLVSNELAAYRASEELEIGESIQSLSEFSEIVKLDTTERKEFESLKIRNSELEEQLELENQSSESLKADINLKSEKITELEETVSNNLNALNELVQENITVEIPAASAEYVVNNMLLIGVESVYGNRAEVRISENESFMMRPGKTVERVVSGL